MDFTGERYIPGKGLAGIAYEHVSRYLFVQPLATGKQVLDAASGEGYGSRILANTAASVIGVDLSWEAVELAVRRYVTKSSALSYLQGRVTNLPFEARTIDLVVAFEILEHISEHDEMLKEIRRVLRPGGVLAISTPNKAAYSDLPKYKNPFHIRELYFDGFSQLLERYFPTVHYFAQKNLTGSLIAPIDETQAARLRVKRIRLKMDAGEFESTPPESVDHMYFIAACSDSPESLLPVTGVVVSDRDEQLRREALQRGPVLGLSGSRNLSCGSDAPVVNDVLVSAFSFASTLRAQIETSKLPLSTIAPEQSTYDLIIPSFNAVEVMKRCLDSLIRNTDHKHLIHVVDDASTDPHVDTMMRNYVSQHSHIRYYRLPENLGFPGAVNVGFATTTRDVVLLNSDTEFPPEWLGRLDHCRRSSSAIHAVSPLSNNATICSVPGCNEANRLPRGLSVDDMDQLVQQTSLRRYPRAPTAVGFCMLITREALQAIGQFDMAFGRGYGEEVDWCQRAWSKGYESAICDDLYVYHHGGGAFSQSPDVGALRATNQRRFERRWPGFNAALRDYCALNPLRYQQQRLYEVLRHQTAAPLRVLHVTHGFDQNAGVEVFTRQLTDGMHEKVTSTVLYPASLPTFQDALVEQEGGGLLRGGLLKVRVNTAFLPVEHTHRGVSMTLRSLHAERLFADVLAASEARIVQFSHLANLASLALPLIARAMGAKVVMVLHDYFLLCPDWNLLHSSGTACGEARAASDSAKCVDCLERRIQSPTGLAKLNVPEFIDDRTAMARLILEQADALIAPSVFVRDQFIRAWGSQIGGRIRVISHGTPEYPVHTTYQPKKELRIAFLGNATHVKGIGVFVEAANRLRGTSIRFQILGWLLPDSNIGVHDNVAVQGSYIPRELPRLLQEVDVAYIGSLSNETYCYTVDEAFRACVPVIASAVGAIPERVTDEKTGLLIPPGDVEALVGAIRRLEQDRTLLTRMRQSISAIRLRSVTDEVAEYLQLYDELAANRNVSDHVRAAMAVCTATQWEAVTTLEDVIAEGRISLSLPMTPEIVAPTSAQRKRATSRH